MTNAAMTNAAMTNDATPPSGRLLHLGLLRFSGADSLSFLQGQVSNDTRRLADGQGLFAAYSSPQGRVLALLHLLPHSSGTVAILPRELVAPTLEALRRFVLRAKVKIEDASDSLWVHGHYLDHHAARQASHQAPARPGDSAYVEKDGVATAPVNHDAGRRWVIVAADSRASPSAPASPSPHDAERAWRLADIRAGLPQVYLATRETFVAQMLNLDLLDGISFSKGCYTGQEIVARTQHLGRIKRRLYRLQLPDGEWTVGQSVRLTDGRAGRLTEVAKTETGFEALAVLPVESAGAAGDAGAGDGGGGGDAETSFSVAARALPLPYQL
jgi:folate-binding protein YgfZ